MWEETTDNLTIEDIEVALRECSDFQKFRQALMHRLGVITETDKAIHARNLERVKRIRNEKKPHYKFNPNVHKPSFIKDEFEEFRE